MSESLYGTYQFESPRIPNFVGVIMIFLGFLKTISEKMPPPFRTHLAVTLSATYKAIKILFLPNVSPYILVKSGNGLRINHEEGHKQSTIA
jgi:hypothetical protein